MTKQKLIVIKRYCPQCGEYKSVFDMDEYDRTICIECGYLLGKREVDLNG